MATLNFPPTPINGETYSSGGVTWTYNSTYSVWNITSSGPTGYTGSKGDIGYTGSQGDTGYTGSTGAGFTPLVGGQSWNTDGSLINTNVYWYVPEPPGFGAFAVGNYILLSDQTSGSTYYYYGRITLIQFAGGFGWALHADILGDGGVPIGGSSSSWITELTGQRGQIGYSGSQGAIGYTGSAAVGGGSSFTVGQVIQSAVAPSTGTWLQTGKYYSKASYSALAAVLGDVPDIGTPVTMAKAQIPVAVNITNTGGRALYSMATSGTAWVFATTTAPKIIYTTDGASFATVPTNATLTNITGIWYVNGQFVATAAPTNTGATLIVSSDGKSWSGRTMQASGSGGTTSANAIAYGAGVYVIAYSGAIFYSTDLITFTQAAPTTLTNVYSKVIYAGGQFVAVSQNSTGTIITSPDGINWTTRTNPISCAYLDVIYANSLYVAYGTISSGNLVTSSDGITWTSRSVGASNIIQVIYGGGQFVAATVGGVYTSADGLTWSLRTTNIISSTITSVGYVGTTYYVGSSTDGYYATSSDATTWTLKRDISGGGFFGMFNVNGKAVGVGNMGIVILDGGIREAYEPIFTIDFNSSFQIGGRQVAYNGSNQYVAVSSRGLPLYSSDAISWTAAPLPGGVSLGTGNISYFNGNYLIGGANTTQSIATSPDGINWTVRTTPTTTGINQFAFGASTYVAVGNNGNIFSSTDLVTWTSRTAGASTFGDVIFANGQFLAINTSGGVYTSPDGVTWTLRSTGGTGTTVRIIWAGGTINLYIVISGGSIYTSPDGVTWNFRSGGNLGDIAFDSTNNILMAVGGAGAIYSSTNGTTWINRTMGYTSSLLGNVTYDGTQWLAFVITSVISGYFKSTDNGVTWVRVAFPDSVTARRVMYIGGKYIRLASSYISVSSDGVTWRSVDQVSYRSNSLSTIQKINNKYFAMAFANYPIVWTSSDGITFTPSRTAVHGYITYTGSAYINVYYNNNGPVGVYRSTDGDTWTHYADVSQSTDTSSTRSFNSVGNLTDIAYSSGKLSFFTGNAATSTALNTQTVYYSSDGGLTWASGNFPAGQQTSGVSGTDGTTLVVGAANYGVYKTTDGGANWTAIYGIASSPVIYTGGYWYWASLHTPDASNIISGPAQTITALGSFNGYGFNINGASAITWESSNNVITPLARLSFAIPGNIALSTNSKETPVRTSDNRALALSNFGSTPATVTNSIIEYPMFSYDTSTTFFVPQQVVGLASNEYIYAGA